MVPRSVAPTPSRGGEMVTGQAMRGKGGGSPGHGSNPVGVANFFCTVESCSRERQYFFGGQETNSVYLLLHEAEQTWFELGVLFTEPEQSLQLPG